MKRIYNFKLLFVFFILFFSYVVSAAEPPSEGVRPLDGEVPYNYVFRFLRNSADGEVYIAPTHRGNGSGSNEDHSTQGIASIDETHWILSKNKYVDTFKLDSLDYFSDDDKVNNFEPESKAGDIDFWDGLLYVPDDKLRIYKWKPSSEDYEELAGLDWPDGLPFAAVFPYRKIVFTGFAKGTGVLKGWEVSNGVNGFWETGDAYRIKFVNKSGYTSHNPCSVGTDSYCTQGANFSPNGRFVFYVRDHSHPIEK